MGDILDRLREKIIADAFEDGTIQGGMLAERLIVERREAADEIDRLRRGVKEISRFLDENRPGDAGFICAALLADDHTPPCDWQGVRRWHF